MEINLNSQLRKLKIDVSGIEESSISTWNNKHLPDTVAFFTWFTSCLSENNILEPSENEEYEFLVAKDQLPHDDEYDTVIADIEQTNPGIFTVQLNESQIHILESDYEALKEYERKLEHQIQVNTYISKRIEKEIRSVKNKRDILSINYENSYDECVGNAKTVDFGFSDLRINVLDSLDCWKQISSIYDIDNNKNVQNYKSGLAYVSGFCDNFCVNSVTLQLEQSFDSELDTIKKRLYAAILYSYIAKVKEKQLEYEVSFYKNLDSLEGLVMNTDQCSNIQAESLELSRKLNTDNSLQLLKDMTLKYVKNHIDKLNFIKLEKTILEARNKYAILTEIKDTVTYILSYNRTQLNLFEIIDQNMQAMDVFLREELPSIINTDLRRCIIRTGSMKERIQEYKNEEQKSIEKQNKLLRILVNLISNDYVEEITRDGFKNLMNKFYGTISDYEMKLFFTDIEIYRSKANVLERNNYFIKEHLKSRSSNEIVMSPLEYSSALYSLREASKEADGIVAKVIQSRKSTDHTLRSNKWLRIRRQLWMYFLVKPRKVLDYLKEIAEENNDKISTQINEDNKIIRDAHKYMKK